MDAEPLPADLMILYGEPWELVPVRYDVLGETIDGFEVGSRLCLSSAFCRNQSHAAHIARCVNFCRGVVDLPGGGLAELLAERDRLKAELRDALRQLGRRA